ncbi:MAG TPA: DUF3084 domain-containing protein [Armatimonadota bacterium]|nr:DUF3084 domain-containing protein [Armatimonadota bacterium]
MGGYGVFLIAALIVVSGVIAYVGDIIGRRMGRRRLTLFHLRPRHTAVAISVFAGMLIAAFTLTSAMLVSQNVRDAFLHVAAMRRENLQLERTARELEARAVRVQRRLDDAQGRLREVSAALRSQTGELTSTKGQLLRVSGQLRRKAAQLEAQKRDLQATTARLHEVAGELAGSRRDLTSTRSLLASAREQLDQTSAQLAQVEQNLADKSHELQNATRVSLEIGRNLLSLESQRDALQAEVGKLQAQIQDLSQWRSRALQTFGEIRTQFGEIRSQPVIFGANEDMLTLVVEGARPAEQVQRDLRQMVTSINQVADAAGAGKGEDNRAIAVFRPVLDEDTGQVVYYGEEQVLAALAATISATPGSVIVRAVSVGNVVRGETVLVDFELFHNALVFRRDQEIARTSVSSSLDEVSLFLELWAFLRGQVSARARAAGVMALPAGHPGEHVESLFPEPDEVVGKMRYPELLHVIREVKRHRDHVLVVARAAADTWTAGPLQVRLEVEGRE